MDVVEFLKKNNTKYELLEHKSVFSSQRMAAVEHVSGKTVAKPVIVNADGTYYMCVLPGCYKIDLEALRKQIGAEKADLADEKEMARLFEDCSLGAEPPFGNLYDMTTLMDKTLETDEYIVFQAGTHEKACRIRMDDYLSLVQPKILDFCYRGF
ncbi:MAG: YbaK/EbsC family protein [Planctomycetota bacterium]